MTVDPLLQVEIAVGSKTARMERSKDVRVGDIVARRDVFCIHGQVTNLRRGKALVRWSEHTSTWTAITSLNVKGRLRNRAIMQSARNLNGLR